MNNKTLFTLALILTGLTGCGLLKRDRVSQHNGIQRSDLDLPVFAYPAADNNNTKTLVLLLSGDGGWMEFEDSLAVQFAKEGYTTIGFNSRDYFWNRKTPKQTAEDLSALLHVYIDQYNPQRIILCGYSFGADVIPFIYNRFHPKLKKQIKALGIMSPFATTDFMVHTSDLLNIAKDNWKYNVRKEINHVKIPIICFYGQNETPRPQEGNQNQNFHLKLLPGNHQYDNTAYKEIITTILNTFVKHFGHCF